MGRTERGARATAQRRPADQRDHPGRHSAGCGRHAQWAHHGTRTRTTLMFVLCSVTTPCRRSIGDIMRTAAKAPGRGCEPRLTDPELAPLAHAAWLVWMQV